MKIRQSFLNCSVLCMLALMSLTSCGDIEQNLIIKADGSGTLETSFEVGEMMSMLKGFEDAGVEDDTLPVDKEVDAITPDVEAPKDPMQLLIDKVTNPEYAKDFDTIIPLVSIMPDSIQKKESRPDLVKKLAVRMKSPASSSDLTIGLIMNFDNQAQLQELVKYM